MSYYCTTCIYLQYIYIIYIRSAFHHTNNNTFLFKISMTKNDDKIRVCATIYHRTHFISNHYDGYCWWCTLSLFLLFFLAHLDGTDLCVLFYSTFLFLGCRHPILSLFLIHINRFWCVILSSFRDSSACVSVCHVLQLV